VTRFFSAEMEKSLEMLRRRPLPLVTLSYILNDTHARCHANHHTSHIFYSLIRGGDVPKESHYEGNIALAVSISAAIRAPLKSCRM